MKEKEKGVIVIDGVVEDQDMFFEAIDMSQIRKSIYYISKVASGLYSSSFGNDSEFSILQEDVLNNIIDTHLVKISKDLRQQLNELSKDTVNKLEDKEEIIKGTRVADVVSKLSKKKNKANDVTGIYSSPLEDMPEEGIKGIGKEAFVEVQGDNTFPDNHILKKKKVKKTKKTKKNDKK